VWLGSISNPSMPGRWNINLPLSLLG
jgi:hypothetical protein